MANVIIRKIFLTGSFQPLTSERLVGNFMFRASANSSAIALQTDDASDEVPIARSETFTLERVNLQDIRAKGALGDYLIVIGATAK